MEENIITSVQNTRIKHVVALQQKSALRREEGLFVVEGQREIEHCIACGYEVKELFVLDSLNYTGHLHATIVTPQVYEKMAYRESTEGIIAVAKCKGHRLKDISLKSIRSSWCSRAWKSPVTSGPSCAPPRLQA